MTDKKPESDPTERVSSMYTQFDERSFCFYTRKLSQDPHFWPTADQLMKALVANSKEPFPALLEQHLRQRLDGTAKKRRGRKKNGLSSNLKRLLVPIYYRKYLEWLQTRERRQGLEGWPLIRAAHWWQGPPHERAARMVQARFRLPFDWRQVLNIVSHENS